MKSIEKLFIESFYEMMGGKERFQQTIKSINQKGYTGEFCKMVDREKYKHLDNKKRYRVIDGEATEIVEGRMIKSILNVVITLALILALFVIGVMIGVQEGMSYQQEKLRSCHKILTGEIRYEDL